MPRPSVFRQVDPERLTPFAQIVYDYMLSQRPNMSVQELSDKSGISPNAITSWLKHGILPRRATIVQLAEHVPELAPLDEMLVAAGLPITKEIKRERVDEVAMRIDSIQEFKKFLKESPRISDAERPVFERFMELLSEEYIGDTDTWREWNDPSPALHEAHQGVDAAMVYHPEPISSPEEAHGQPGPQHKRRESGQPRRHSQI